MKFDDRLKQIIREEISREYRRINPKDSEMLEIAYDLREYFGLYSSYHGGFKKFDGHWDDMDITIQYHGSGDRLEVYVSPKFNAPTKSKIVEIEFTSTSKFEANIKDGKDLGSHSYANPSSFGSKIKTLLNKVEENQIIEQSAVDTATGIAQMAHAGQYRRSSGKPYIVHPVRVKQLAKQFGYGKDVQIVAILHDVLEDSPNEKHYREEIKRRFGPRVLKAVKALTHEKNQPYDEYLLDLSRNNALAFKVKMMDMASNLMTSPTESQREKYKNAISKLLDNGIDVPEKIKKLLRMKIEGIVKLTKSKLREIVREMVSEEHSDLSVVKGNRKISKITGMPEEFIVVEYPTPHDTLYENVYRTDYQGLMEIGRGSSEPPQIFGVYALSEKDQAMQDAQNLMMGD